MFTGIIEATGIVEEISTEGANRIFWIKSAISDQLKVDQSVSHDGVCLTVDRLSSGRHRVTAVKETLEKSCLGEYQPGRCVNLERSLVLGSRLDGHLVQGHVDTTGTCLGIEENDGSWNVTIGYPPSFAALLIEKGSIALNGISLTVFNVTEQSFTVTIIPYTWEHTNMQWMQPGDNVNLEFDMLGKYVNRIRQLEK